MNYIIHVQTQAEWNAVIEKLQPLGFNDLSGCFTESHEVSIILVFPGKRQLKYGDLNGIGHRNDYSDLPVIPFAHFAAIHGIELNPDVTIGLTDDYEAVISYNKQSVKVGCQTIPFNKVNELFTLIKQQA